MSLELILYLKQDFSGPQGVGHVIFLNLNNKPLHIWSTGNQWGDDALWFELSRPPLKARIERKIQNYTVNVPSTIQLPPGGSHTWHFDLNDGSWESDVQFDKMLITGSELSVIYEAVDSPEARTQGVLIGRWQSKPVKLE